MSRAERRTAGRAARPAPIHGVPHHLSRLSEVGLVSARREPLQHLPDGAKGSGRVAQRLLSQEPALAAVAGVDLDAYDRKVATIQSRRAVERSARPAKKLDAILRHVVRVFKLGLRYSEREVNEILARFHEDTAFWCRELVGASLLARSSSGGGVL